MEPWLIVLGIGAVLLLGPYTLRIFRAKAAYAKGRDHAVNCPICREQVRILPEYGGQAMEIIDYEKLCPQGQLLAARWMKHMRPTDRP